MTPNQAAVEAILFAGGESVPVERIAEVLDCERAEVEGLIDRIAADYQERGAGIQLVRMDGTCQMTTCADHADVIRQCLDLRRAVPLSPAAFEVLAVVAYNQPVTKAFIEQVRGVDCSGVVSSLCEKGLVAEAGRLDLPGRPLLYATTPDFLRCFQMETLADLPPLPSETDGEQDERAFAQVLAEQQLTLEESASGGE